MAAMTIIASSRIFGYGDELMHWAPHTKVMFQNDGFMHANDQLFHKAYPPGARLFHYLFFSMGGFSESRALLAQVLISVSTISLFARNIPWSGWRKAFLFVTFGFLIIVLYGFRVGPLHSLLMDRAVGVFLGAALVMYFLSDKKTKDVFLLIPVLFSLMLFKAKLLPLALLLVVIVGVDQCVKRGLLRSVFPMLALVGAVLVAKSSWLWFLASVGVAPEWSTPFTFSDVMVSFSSQASGRDLVTIDHFKSYLWDQSGIIIALLGLSYLFPLGFSSISERKRWWRAGALLFAGLCAYLFGLLLLYLYVFKEFHGLMLASILRYSGIYFIFWTYFVLASFQRMLQDSSVSFERSVENVLVVMFIVILGAAAWFSGMSERRAELEYRSRNQLREQVGFIAEAVKDKTPSDAKVFLVWQNSMGLQAVTLIYDLMPRYFNDRPAAFGAPYTEDAVWTQDITSAEFVTKLQGYDYLLLAYTDERFWSRYGELFSGSRDSIIPLLRYTQCEGEVFNDALEYHCIRKAHKAYLFKIDNIAGGLILQNMASGAGQ